MTPQLNQGYKNIRNVLATDITYPPAYYSPELVNALSKEITIRLRGVDRYNRGISVPNKTILSVLDSVYQSFPRDTFQNKAKMAAAIIVETIKQEYEAEGIKNTLSADALKYDGTFGNRLYPQLKMREKRPNFSFAYRY